MSLERLVRRSFLGAASGFFAFALRNQCSDLWARAATEGKAKRCLVLWMDGGPSHIDTLDPKPGSETGGEFRAISTAVPGVRIGEHLPRVAQRLNRLTLIRSLQSPEGEHVRAKYLLHTGYPLVESFARPPLGAVVSKHAATASVPQYVALGAPGFGPAYMGAPHAPFAIENAAQSLQMLRALRARRTRLTLTRQLGKSFVRDRRSDALKQRDETIRRLETLIDTSFADALDVTRARRADRQRYGEGPFAERCLVARRLLESGVSFVEVQQSGWDTHVDNFRAVANLCRQIDKPWAALLDDLVASGLLKETVVLWIGEFGRTPTINARSGRDHYPRVTCAAVAGGGLPGGRVLGVTDARGADVKSKPARVADLLATVMNQLGIDPKRRFITEFGGTATLTDEGKPLKL